MKKILLIACGLLGSLGGNASFAEVTAKKPAVRETASGNAFLNPFAAAANRSLCAPKSNFQASKVAVAMSGNYTINKNAAASATNFVSFTAAVQALQTNGVAGAVTFTVVANSGPYNELVVLPVIPGTSATNTITFEGNGNSVSATPNATNQGVFTFNGADYVKLNNLQITVDAATTAGSGVYYANASDNDAVTNCTVNVSLANNGFTVHGILTGNTGLNNANNLLLQNNIINGGYSGIYLMGLATTTGNRILNNQIRDSRTNGIYLQDAGTGTIIEGNDISRPTRINSSGLTGVSLNGATSNTIVSKNRVHNTHDQASNKLSYVYGFQSFTIATPGNENIFRNNIVYNLTNQGGSVYGFYNADASNTYYYHNTVSVDNPAMTYINLRGFYVQYNSTNVKIVNNIVSLSSFAQDKHAIYLGGNMQSLISNNNVLFVGSNGGYIGYFQGNNPTLASWRAANGGGYDLNSVSVDPVFVNAINGQLMPTATTAQNIGQPLASVTDDIMGNPRSTTTPDPGAYEFTQPAIDAGATAITAPTSPVTPGNQAVTIVVKNYGTSPLTSLNIGWKVNGVLQPNYTWTGNLASLATGTVTLGTYNFPAGSVNLCAWTNVTGDLNKSNDSTCATMNVCAGMSGNYTIDKNNPTAGTNFQSISAAAARLVSCGVSGPVTLTVAPNSGPYNEQVEILDIPNTSATNTVTFEGSGNTVSTTPGARFGIFVLNGADYVKLNNFVITMPATVTQGWGVQLINAADHNTISNNTINLPIVTSTSNLNGIVSGTAIEAKGNFANYTKIQNNTVNGGGCGIELNGDNGGLFAVNNEITGNQVKDSYYYGIFVGNGSGTLIEGNDISRPTRTTTPLFNGIYLFGETTNSTISKNRIHNTHDMITATGTSVNGIYYSMLSNIVGNNTFKNNLIYNLNCVAGNAVGIYSSGGSNNFFYHNTITSDPAFTYNSVRGIYLTNAAAGVKFQNNLIALPGPTGNKYAIYLGSANIALNSNNNNLYVGNAGSIGYDNLGGYPNLADWQTAFGHSYDLNSVSVDPVFVNPATGNFQPTSVGTNDKGQAQPTVTDDILGFARNPVTPDPGAYEFGVAANDVGIIGVSGPVSNGCGLTATESITVTIKNYGTAAKTSIPLSYSVNGVAIAAPETFTGNLAPFATATYTFSTKANLAAAGNYRIIARTVLSGDAIPANDPDTLEVVNYMLSGLPVNLNFETPATGLAKLRKVSNLYSRIMEDVAGSNGSTSTKGLVMDGIDNNQWVTPGTTSNPWTMNPANFAGAYFCFSPGSGAATDSLILTFDLKQLFKTANSNTNFRVTVNGTQVGQTYRPPFSGPATNWQKIKVNLMPYLNNTTIQIGLESSVKETYSFGNGTANLIDNILVVRKAGITGVGEVLANQLAIFPNPSTGAFSVNLPEGKNYWLKVTDLTGKTILKQEAKGNTQLNLDKTAKGIYLLKVSSNNSTVVQRLIVE